MFKGNNATQFFAGEMEQNFLGFQYDFDPSTQLQLYGHAPAACNGDATNFTGNNNVPALNRPNKRSRETDNMGRQQKVQISLNDFFQDEAGRSRNIPNLNAVPTGLRLSYDDDEHNSSVTSASGSVPFLPSLLPLSDKLRAEIDRQNEEADYYMKIQEETIIKGLKEMKQRHITSIVKAIENGTTKKLREKDVEIENMNRRSRELIEQMRQISTEVQTWQQKARYAESVANVLKGNIKQAIAQAAAQGKEGCGDSEVDNAASSYHPCSGPVSEQSACKSCRNKEACIVLMPCRHLCLCEDCVGFIDVCPVCEGLKTGCVQIQL